MSTKQVFPTEQIPHLWANQIQDSARNSAANLYFNGKKIYSYGNHFCIANIVKPGIVLFTNRGYSNTTAKHISAVHDACRHLKIIKVCDPDDGLTENLKDFAYQLKNNIDTATAERKPRAQKEKYESDKLQARENLKSILINIDEYLSAIDTKFSQLKKLTYRDFDLTSFKALIEAGKSEQALQTVSKKLKKIEADKARKLAEARAERLEEAKKDLVLWKRGGHLRDIFRELPIALRKRVETTSTQIQKFIQTSHGASITYKAGEILYKMIKAGKDIKGYDLDGYTVIGINGTLKIGCHEIDRKEIDRFAKSQKW